MPLEGLTHVGPRNHVLAGGQDQPNTFAAAMRPFAKLLLTPVITTVVVAICYGDDVGHNMLVAVSKGMRTVKLCLIKIWYWCSYWYW